MEKAHEMRARAENSVKKTRISAILLFILCSLFAILLAMLIVFPEFASVSAHAAPLADAPLDPDDPVFLSIAPNTGLVELGALADASEVYEQYLTVTTRTNSPQGYALYLTMADSNTCLRHEDYIAAADYGDSTPCASVPAGHKLLAGDPTSIDTNIWGYSVDDGSTYITPLPFGSGSAIKATSSETSAPGDPTTITFGAKRGPGSANALAAGEYSGHLVMTAVANRPPAPEISSISPATGTAGTMIAITGANFNTAYQVQVGGADCTSAAIISDTQITCAVPTGTVGTSEDVAVTTWGGSDTLTGGFTYLPPAQDLTEACLPTSFAAAGQALPSAAQGIVMDLDPNMIPVKYTGDTTAPQWQTTPASNIPNAWYDYASKQWANAVTVTAASLAAYQNTDSVTINEADVLGYWVYIPRYRYQVQRCGTAQPAITTPTLFNIQFENKAGAGYEKAFPADNGDWVTHPAFTFGTAELNGIWVGKFETTGTAGAPTVKPNSASLKSQTVLAQWNTARAIQSTHGLSGSYDTRMARNSDWGAMAYLASSAYGTGVASGNEPGLNGDASEGGVRINSNTSYATGCGPLNSAGSTATYAGGTTCAPASDNVNRSYYTDLGRFASTTGNPYGIYDMSGGAYDCTLANYAGTVRSSGLTSDGSGGFTQIADKYIDFYPENATMSNCDTVAGGSFATCGGQALFETAGWNGDGADLVTSAFPWSIRGGYYNNGAAAGVFRSFNGTGSADTIYAFRPVLSLF